ncbi:hypothetical protein B0H13DRAFT_1915550 [Mycena leptocephala]|nr:hypothetical protein B0H13DRAFT_1915550 [Mycena leptocephala]
MNEWFHSTKWFPVEFVDSDVLRHGREYEFKWIPGIVWAAGDLEDMTFYRSIAQWVELDGVGGLREDQIGAIYLPQGFKSVPEDAKSLNPPLSQLFLFAVPTIARILFPGSFQGNSMERRSIPSMDEGVPSPALDAMLKVALGMLSANELMCMDPLANQKIWGPGSVLFQLLAIQHSLDEPRNLNSETFLQIQAGRLRSSRPRAIEGLHEMEIENQMSMSGVLEWEAKFKAAHTVFENSADLVFYHRDGGWNPEIIPSLPAVNIRHNGRTIKLPDDLPLLPPAKQRGEKRAFVGEDVFGDGPVPKRKETGSKKYEPKPTPPHARRSTRRKKKNPTTGAKSRQKNAQHTTLRGCQKKKGGVNSWVEGVSVTQSADHEASITIWGRQGGDARAATGVSGRQCGGTGVRLASLSLTAFYCTSTLVQNVG